MVFAIECPIPLTPKMAEKRENPEKIGDVRSHLSPGGRPAKPLYLTCDGEYIASYAIGIAIARGS